MPGPIGMTMSRLADVADTIQARLWVTHDTHDARPIPLQHVDKCDPDASAKDLRPDGPSPWDIRGTPPDQQRERTASWQLKTTANSPDDIVRDVKPVGLAYVGSNPTPATTCEVSP
jgi:hypothetical protein